MMSDLMRASVVVEMNASLKARRETNAEVSHHSSGILMNTDITAAKV